MKVFVVERCFDYEGCDIVGVYASREAANRVAEEQQKDCSGDLCVTEHEVEE